MRVTATAPASETIRRVVQTGRAQLVLVLSNGCCDSTAPYLFDHYVPEAGSEQVGAVEGVPILAPEWIRALYAGEEGLVVDVIDEPNDDSLSLETDLGRRFVLRAPGNTGLG